MNTQVLVTHSRRIPRPGATEIVHTWSSRPSRIALAHDSRKPRPAATEIAYTRPPNHGEAVA